MDQRPDRLLGCAEARDRAGVRGCRRVGAHPDTEHRPVGTRRGGGDAAGDLGHPPTQWRHEDRHDRVVRTVDQQAAERPLVVVRRGRDHQVRAQAPRLAGVRAQNAGPASVCQHRHPVAFRQRLVREQLRDVEHLPHRLGPHHAGVREQRVDAGIGAQPARP